MRFVSEHPEHSVELVLRVLGIASSTFYGWLKQARQPSARRLADEELLAEIVDVHTSSGGTYGAPRVHAMLRRRGVWVGRKRVERLMRQAGLQGAFLRKKWRIPSTRQNPRATPAPDLVNRDFTADAPNRLWVADATRIPAGEGVFWLATVRDAFSNRIVGWKCSDRCDTDLVLGALEYAVWARLGIDLEQIRADRVLQEALSLGSDPLHLAQAFGLSDKTAVEYATIARTLAE
ncbi:IS3 family transposase [Nocardia sp. NPDC050630]|uniref:IS3 family transposase n=1 Tax=Nocardia sp. NPDC050630 TaxID=3364321 RepID=UPI0037B742DA